MGEARAAQEAAALEKLTCDPTCRALRDGQRLPGQAAQTGSDNSREQHHDPGNPQGSSSEGRPADQAQRRDKQDQQSVT